MSQPSPAAWRWKVEQRAANPRLNLLYEPGNWGDVLKGEWALALAAQLLRDLRGRPFRYCDPFAGAPSYPLTGEARARLAQAAETLYAQTQQPFAARGELAGTGGLVRALCAVRGVQCECVVYDQDAARRTEWERLPGARWLPVESGEAALAAVADGAEVPDLLLIDPYDFLERWREFLPLTAAAARRTVVLVYLYNKAPRSAGHWNQYRHFRQALAKEAGHGASLLGRLPSDALLPRACHEVLALGPAGFLEGLLHTLSAGTRALAARLAAAGAFEQGGLTGSRVSGT